MKTMRKAALTGLTAATAMTAALLGTSALADDGFYSRLDGGYASSSKLPGDIYTGTGFGGDFGSGGTVGGGLGYRHTVSSLITLRADLTATGNLGLETTHSATVGTGNAASTLAGKVTLSAIPILLSGYVDFNLDSIVSPYVGAGVGTGLIDVARINYTINGRPTYSEAAKTSQGPLTYQATAGVTVKVDGKLHVDLAYHYTNYGTVSSSGQLVSLSGATTTYPQLKGKLETNGFSVGLRYHY